RLLVDLAARLHEFIKELTLGPCANVSQGIGRKGVGDELTTALRQEVGSMDLDPREEHGFFIVHPLPADAQPEDRKENKPLRQFRIKIYDSVWITIAVLEKICMHPQEPGPLAAEFIFDEICIEQQISAVGVAFLTDCMNDLVGCNSEGVNR